MDEEEDYSEFLQFVNDCDPHDPLLSQTRLGARLSKIPLDCIPATELNSLTLALSVEQLIGTESRLARDYRGMAELMGFSSIEIETRFKKSNNSAKSLIDAFIYRNSPQEGDQSNRFSVTDLLKIIERIERFDVIDEILPKLVELATPKPTTSAIQNISHSSDNLNQDVDRLTFDDTHENTVKYDAFICYAPQDIIEAQDLKSELQNRGKKVATADDLLPGHFFEHDALMRLIDMRCRKVIIVVTRNFCHSKECEFQLKFASEVAIKGNDLKIIPVLFEMIPPDLMPGMIRYTSKINLNDPLIGRAMQFDRLIRSLDYFPPPPSLSNGQCNSHLTIEPNRRTSSFNGRTSLEPSNANHTNGHHYNHSYSNGSSPTVSRSNDPIVEIPYSQKSIAMRNPPSPRQITDDPGTDEISTQIATCFGVAASSKPKIFPYLTTKIRNNLDSLRSTFSSKKKTNLETNENYRHPSSFASQSPLISESSNRLTTDENVQSGC